MNKKTILIIGGILFVTVAVLGLIFLKNAKQTPIYVTFYSHNENDGYWESLNKEKQLYEQYRQNLIDKVELIHKYGATLNWQTDYAVLNAMIKHEEGDLLENTNGKNILRWMSEDMGVSIDVHRHPSDYNFADIAYLIEQLGVTPSSVVGGFGLYRCSTRSVDDVPVEQLGDIEEQLQLDSDGYITGNIFNYRWRPGILTQASSEEHVYEESSSGVWQPNINGDFLEHNPSGDLIYVGQGYPFDPNNMGVSMLNTMVYYADSGYIKELAELINKNDIGCSQIYTASISTRDSPDSMGEFPVDTLAGLEKTLKTLQPYVLKKQIIYSTYEDVADVWANEYQSKPNRLGIESFSIYNKLITEANKLCENSEPQKGSCGDGICDEFEQNNPEVCPEDCD